MKGDNLRAFELVESIYNRNLNDYGSEENIDVRLKQSFQMTKSRMEYLKKYLTTVSHIKYCLLGVYVSFSALHPA
jgi:hypothetical protein